MKGARGEITVFLALVLTIMVSLLLSVIEAARNNGVQFQSECVADVALQSALAEYQRELLEQYDLFFLDTGYGTGETGRILLEEHIRKYMEENVAQENGSGLVGMRDLLQMHAEAATVLQAAAATDQGGRLLERAAVDYMLDRYGLPELSRQRSASKETAEKGLLETTIEKRRQENERAIERVDTSVEDEEGKKKKLPVHNPADAVNSRRGSYGILKLVTGSKPLSEKAICEVYLSHRGYREQEGSLWEQEALSGLEDLIFQKYMMEKCGTYTGKKKDSELEYQMEYLLIGKSRDQDNLQGVVDKLLLLRESANFIYLLSDSGKQAEAEAMAAALSIVILFPELKDLIKLSLLIAWAYAEGVNDVKALLGGGRVPLLKNRESWRLGLKNALKLQLSEELSERADGAGMSYEEYLHIFLALLEQSKRNERFMDLMEMDIRRIPGNEGFCMDHCIHGFTAELVFGSAYGHSYRITRTAGYEK